MVGLLGISIIIVLISLLGCIGYIIYKKNLINKKKLFAIGSALAVILSGTVIVMDDPPAAGTTYYVAKTGNDGNTGLDIDNALLTIQHAVRYHATSAGDTIYVRQGNYNEMIYMYYVGTAGNPITLSGYLDETAVINGAGLSIPSGYGLISLWTSTGSPRNNYLTFKNLVIENVSAQRGLRCLDHPTTSPSHITIENCSFNHIHENAIWLGNSQFGAYGRGNNITIKNCSFNYIQDTTHSRECVTIYACDDVLIEYCTWDNINKTAIDICTASDNITIDHNIIDNTGIESGGAGVYLDGSQIGSTWVSNVTISNNSIYGNRQGMRFSSEVINSGLENITIENNILNISIYNGMFFQFDGAVPSYYNDITVKFNTIYVSGGTSPYAISLSMTPSYINDFVIANNIIVSAGATNYQLVAQNLLSTESDLTRANNLYYHTSKTSNTYFSDGTGKFEATAIRQNPEFVSLATYNFHLNQTSPAVDAGSGTYTVSTDYDGISRPKLGGYDIGAYEYEGYPPYCVVTRIYPQDDNPITETTPTCVITATDSDGNTMDIKWYENTTDSWVLQQTNGTVNNGTYRWIYDNATDVGGTYYWKVNCTGSEGETVEVIYHFYIGAVYYAGIRNDGIDYFTWMGANVTASTVGALITGFSEATEYIAIWNLTSWSSTDGLWQKYYGDTSGAVWTVHTFDVIKIYLTDSGTQEIVMAENVDIDYTTSRSVTVTLTAQNKGSNYTGYTASTMDVSTLSGVAGKIDLANGEMVAWWDDSVYEWRVWIEGFSTTEEDYSITQYDVFWTEVGDARTFEVGVVV